MSKQMGVDSCILLTTEILLYINNIINNRDKNTDVHNGMNESFRNDAEQKKLDSPNNMLYNSIYMSF